MTLTFTDGTLTTTASEQTIVDLTADEHFAIWLFLHNMTSSETFRVKVYVKDQNTTTLRQFSTTDYTGVQASPAVFVPFLPTKEFKVTIQRTAGTDKAVTWQTAEVA